MSRLRLGRCHLQIIPADQRNILAKDVQWTNLGWTALKVVRQFQDRRIESRPLATAGEQVKSELMNTPDSEDHKFDFAVLFFEN